jgi:hypothetical protein
VVWRRADASRCGPAQGTACAEQDRSGAGQGWPSAKQDQGRRRTGARQVPGRRRAGQTQIIASADRRDTGAGQYICTEG